jgi:methylated-DNA-[protein]-cysteine S-methyltransferase
LGKNFLKKVFPQAPFQKLLDMNKEFGIASPFGDICAVIGEGKILSLFFTGKADSSPKDVPLSAEDRETAERLKMQLDEYFAGVRREFDLPIALHGTEFQIAVWNAIRRIPYGEVRSYGEVAWMAGYPRAARAVGTACRKNPLLLIVPCHCVVASDGLGGYGGRPDIKRAILRLEGNTAYEPTV